MHAADHRLVSRRRYVLPAVAMASAAAVAVAPVTTSVAAVTAPSLPPIVQDLGGAASAVANWATSMGLKFVTDPVTGLTKLVQDQIGNAGTVIGAATGYGEDFVAYLQRYMGPALEKAQKDIAAGDFGAAWTGITTLMTGSVLAPAIGLLPVIDELGGQLGPFGDAMKAALLPILGIALGPLGAATSIPADLIDGVSAAVEALSAGGPAAALAELFGTFSGANERVIDALFGSSFGLVPSLINLIPAMLGGMADSPWAGVGPFALPTGNAVTFASASALAASPTALPTLPSMPDFGAIGDIWTDKLTTIASGLAGPDGIQRIFSTLLTGVPAAEWSKSYEIIHGILAAPLLELGGAVLETGDLVNPYLGPLGKALDGAAEPLLYLTLGLYNATRMVPSAAFEGMENIVKALATGDPVAALNAGVAGLAATLTEVNSALLSDNPFAIGLLPGLVGVGQGFLDGITGANEETADVSTARVLAGEPVTPAASDDDAPVSASPVTEPTEAEPTVTEPAATAPKAEVEQEETPAAEVVTDEEKTPAGEEAPAAEPEAEAPAAEAPAETEAPATVEADDDAASDAPAEAADDAADDAPAEAAA